MIQRKGKVDVLLILIGIILIAAIVLFILASNDILLFTSIGFFVVVLILVIIEIIHRMSTGNKLRKKLIAATQAAGMENVDSLKNRYQDIYTLYEKLSENKKANFYGRVIKFRTQVEELMQKAKKLQSLLEHCKGTMTQRKKIFAEITDIVGKLPTKEQEKWHQQVVQVKSQLAS
jgi:uncharacterized protein (UPF0333 family)